VSSETRPTETEDTMSNKTPISERESAVKANKRRKLIHTSREAWLQAAIDLFRPLFQDLQATIRSEFPNRYPDAKTTLPRKVRVHIGEVQGGRGKRRKVLGLSYAITTAADGVPAVGLNGNMEDPSQVLDVLCHELIHVAIGNDKGHGHLFAVCAKAMMLDGKPTATFGSAEFKKWAQGALKKLGRLDHAKMTWAGKVQGTRMIKVQCPCCGYTVRTTRKWLEIAIPECPDDGCDAHGMPMEVGVPKKRGTGRPKTIIG
jgi:hypothetical protein